MVRQAIVSWPKHVRSSRPGFLTREEFIALEGNPDYDPFDPRAHSVPGGPQYRTAEETAALETHAESASTGPPDREARTPR